MATLDERFDTAIETAKVISDLSRTMSDLGAYDELEYRAISVLLLSITRVIKILDPDRAREYIESVATDGSAPREIATQNGMYL
jgi:hypothetical protein